jgi:hypothetical protein
VLNGLDVSAADCDWVQLPMGFRGLEVEAEEAGVKQMETLDLVI